MARKGENIYKRKDGRYEGRYIKGYKEDNKPVFGYVYDRKYSEIKKKLVKCKSSLRPVKSLYSWNGDGNAHGYMEYWLHKIAQPSIKPSTYGCYMGILSKHLIPAFGFHSLKNIDKNMVQNFKEVLQNQYLSPITIANIIGLFSNILKQSIKEGWIQKNPCDEITISKNNHKKQKVFTREERRKLVEAVSSSNEETQLEVLLPLYTGLRVGELCALRLDDIDLEHNVIHVRKTVQRVKQRDVNGCRTKILLGEPKSKSSEREVPFPSSLLPILKKRKKKGQSDSFLLGNKKTPVEPRTIQRHFHNLLKSIGLKPRGTHTLRHTFATGCLEQGADIITIGELLGHSSPSITYKYLHTFSSKKHSLIQKLFKE